MYMNRQHLLSDFSFPELGRTSAAAAVVLAARPPIEGKRLGACLTKARLAPDPTRENIDIL